MIWLWTGLAVAVVIPWLTVRRALNPTYHIQGFREGTKVWLGAVVIATPVTVGLSWLLSRLVWQLT